ncbi:MAG TPA: sugar transferase [Solirubrobacterales bacterium]|nr:sugar transferase [Solirubrobacterales bacterium]
MAERQLNPDADIQETSHVVAMSAGAATDRGPLPTPFPSLPVDPFQTVRPPEAEPQEQAPEGQLRAAAYRRDAIYRRTLAAADVAAAGFAVLIGVPILGQDALNPAAVLALPLVLVVGKVTGLYDRDEHLIRKTTLDEVPTLFWVATLYALLIWLAGNLIVQGEFGRNQAVGVWALLFVGMVTMRALARNVACEMSGEERCLVLGDADTAGWITRRFGETAGLKARVVARAQVPSEAGENGHSDLNGHSGLNGHSDLNSHSGLNGHAGLNGGGLERLVKDEQIERAIIAPGGASSDDVLNTTRTLKSIGVRVSVLPRLPEVVGSSVELDDVDGITLLGMRRFGLTRSSESVKRAFDFVGSALGLILLSPFLAAIAIAIKLDSRGPVLFRQPRMGRNGVPFEMLKFRTMVDGADAQKAALMEDNEADGGLFKIKDDPRITRVGNVLRRYSLDELPQLINVLRGEMSLVGPRPLVLDEDRQIEGWRRSRLELPPGMTGPWQVFGSARIPLNEMVKIDYLYGANWSLWLDVKMLLRTVAFVLGRRGL